MTGPGDFSPNFRVQNSDNCDEIITASQPSTFLHMNAFQTFAKVNTSRILESSSGASRDRKWKISENLGHWTENGPVCPGPKQAQTRSGHWVRPPKVYQQDY